MENGSNLFFTAFDGDMCSFHIEILQRSSGLPGTCNRKWFLSETNNNNNHNHHMIWGWGNMHFVNYLCGGMVILVVEPIWLSLQNYFHCYQHRVGLFPHLVHCMRRKNQLSLKAEMKSKVASVINIKNWRGTRRKVLCIVYRRGVFPFCSTHYQTCNQ